MQEDAVVESEEERDETACETRTKGPIKERGHRKEDLYNSQKDRGESERGGRHGKRGDKKRGSKEERIVIIETVNKTLGED